MQRSRPYIPYIPFALVAAVMISVTVFALFRLARPADPPIHYLAAEYTPDRTTYAPHETMVYTPSLKITKEGRVDVLRSFWNRTENTAATLCDGSSAPIITTTRNLPAGMVGNVRGGRAVRIPIPNLPPGDYWLISSASGPGGGQSVYQVPFSVVRHCGA
jgi:hypothetical protein